MRRPGTAMLKLGIHTGEMEKSKTCEVLATELGRYWFRRHRFCDSTTVLYHFERPFARLAGTNWVIFDAVPTCIIRRAARKLHIMNGIRMDVARGYILAVVSLSLGQTFAPAI